MPPSKLLLLLLLYAYDRAHAIPTVPKPDKIAADIPKPPKRVPAGDAAAKEPRASHAQTGRTPSAVGKGTEAENVKAQHAKMMYDSIAKEEKAELTRMKDNGWVTDRMLADWKEEPEQSVASFAYTAALALGALATLPEVELGAEKTKLTVHAMGAAKYREGSVEASFGRLCAVAKQSLKPFALLAEVDIVLVGPDMPSADPVVVERDGCKTTVTTFCGGYSENVAQATLVPPDLVVGFDVDAYTCSWRKSLLYLLQAKLPTVLSFMMPHEALWVEELLAHPTEAFGAAAHKECAVDLKHVRRRLLL